MAPVRVGFIGLSSAKSESIAPGSWAYLAHLPYLLSSPDYEIVALVNSSQEAAQKAIKAYNLPSTTKAYGSPEEIANDPDVDLIVISVVVMKHYQLAKPALLAKKNVFVEWPLGASLAESKELAALAKENGVRTIVGLQARADPLVEKLKEILESGQIGPITSSSVLGPMSGLPTDTWFDGAEYYLDMKNGGNHFMIFFGHCKFYSHDSCGVICLYQRAQSSTPLHKSSVNSSNRSPSSKQPEPRSQSEVAMAKSRYQIIRKILRTISLSRVCSRVAAQ